MHQKFLKLYDQSFDDVYRYVYFKTGNKWDTDDLVSEAFRKAYENFETVKGSPKAWLFTIVRNTVIDFYRKKKDITIGDDLDLYTYPCSFDQDLERKEELEYLKKALFKLPKEELEIINLRYFSELKYQDMAKILGKSAGSIKMKSFRIVRKLKEMLFEYMEG